jgi:hypothetical protein
MNFNRQIRIKQFAALALLALGLTQLSAHGGQTGGERLEVESFHWGIVPGQKTRITVANKNQQDASGVRSDPLIWRVSALDADGNQVFQSPDVATPVAGFRYIDIAASDISMPSETLTGRKQVVWKVILVVPENQLDPPDISAELIDSSGATTLGHTIGLRHEHTRPE